MISHSHKFILILPPRTGSTSLLKRLIDYSDTFKIISQDQGGFDFYETEHDFKNDIKAKHKLLSEYYTDVSKTYIKYGAVRNPYSRMVSWWKLRGGRPFKNFIRGFGHPNGGEFYSKFQKLTYKDYFCTNNICVDNFIRHENIQQDFNDMCERVGLPVMELPKINATNHDHYSSYYDDQSRKIVENLFQEDIDMFNYKFERP